MPGWVNQSWNQDCYYGIRTGDTNENKILMRNCPGPFQHHHLILSYQGQLYYVLKRLID